MFLPWIKTCIIFIIIIFVRMIECGNEVFNMTAVTLGGFARKICSTIDPLLPNLVGKKYHKKPKKGKRLLKRVMLGNQLSTDFIP